MTTTNETCGATPPFFQPGECVLPTGHDGPHEARYTFELPENDDDDED